MGVCIGVDFAKKRLDWVLGPNGEVERIENSPAAVRRFIRKLQKLEFDRVILESTGQYERLLFEALEDEGSARSGGECRRHRSRHRRRRRKWKSRRDRPCRRRSTGHRR